TIGLLVSFTVPGERTTGPSKTGDDGDQSAHAKEGDETGHRPRDGSWDGTVHLLHELQAFVVLDPRHGQGDQRRGDHDEREPARADKVLPGLGAFDFELEKLVNREAERDQR